MKKLILLLIVFVNLSYGYNYNDLLLKAQISIFPKVVLLDKKLQSKLVDGNIVYTIVYHKSDYNTAMNIHQMIDNKYHGHFDAYPYKINLVEFSKLSYSTPATALYILDTQGDLQNIIDIAFKKGIITFSYEFNNLKKGLLFSLMIEKSTILYLNKEKLFIQDIDFVDALLQMVKFVDTYTVHNQSKIQNQIESLIMYAKISFAK